MAPTDVVAGSVTRSQVIHEAFVLAGLSKSGRSLTHNDLERGELHLRSIADGLVMRENDISDLTRRLAMCLIPIYPTERARVDIEREEETLP